MSREKGQLRERRGLGVHSGAIHVLCVDDAPSFLKCIASHFKRQHEVFTVTIATSEQEARGLADSVDCIVSRYQLPDGNGLELLDAVRAVHPDLPFFLAVDHDTGVDAAEAFDAGVTDYLERRPWESQHVSLANRIEQAVTAERDVETYDSVLAGAVDALDDLFYLFTPDGEFLMWNDAVREVTGYTDAEIAAMGPADFFAGEAATRVAEAIGRVLDTGQAVVEAELVTKSGERIPYEFTGARLTDRSGEPSGICGIGRDISERKQREAALREREAMLDALHDATRRLTHADTDEAIAARTVEIADEVLNLSGTAVYLFDERSGGLRPVSYSLDVEALVDEMPTLAPGEGVVGDTFLAGETRVYDDIHTRENLYDPESPIRSGLFVPLGDHGVFASGDTVMAAFTTLDVEFAEILAANVETALDRIEREQSLRERDRKFERRNERLQQLNRINSVIRGIGQTLVHASTRGEVYRSVCDRLVEIESYRFACVTTTDDAGNVELRAYADDDGHSADWVRAAGPGVGDQVKIALHERDSQVVSDLLEGRAADPWRRAALERGYQSVITVPLVHGQVAYAALQLYATEVDAFDADTRTVLAELGETIGYALTTIGRKEALLADADVQLEFQVGVEGDFFFQLACEVGDRVTLQTILPTASGSLALVTVADPQVDRVMTLAAQDAHIVDASLVAERDERCLFECRVVGSTVVTTLAEHGARPRAVVADPDGGRVVADLPPSAVIRAFVEAVTAEHPTVELVARRTTDAIVESSFHRRLADRLTARQQEALETAYYSGFFEWPRQTTGEEVAEILGVAPSTFHQHLRTAERKVVSALLAE